MASFSEEDIMGICDQIFEKLGVEFDLQDLGILLQENIYIELYRIMFPYLEKDLVEIADKKSKPAQKIQELINLLSTQVLNMDLSHIKGDFIAKGDKKHILNFLQLLFEVIKLLPTPNKELIMHSAPLSNLSSQHDSMRRRTVLGIHDEFPSMNFDQDQNQENIELPEGKDPNEGEDQEEQMEEGEKMEEGHEQFDLEEGEEAEGYEEQVEREPLIENLEENLQNEAENQEEEFNENEEEEHVQIETSKNIIKEVPKSEESSEYDRPHYGLTEKRKSSGKINEKKHENKENYEKKMSRDKSKKNLVEDLYSQKQVHKKLIGETLFVNQGKNTKVLQKDMQNTQENLIKTKKIGRSKIKSPEEEKIKELLEEGSHSEHNKSQKSKQSDDRKKSLKEVDQNEEFLKFNENMYEILADNIEKIRESLKNMKKTNLSEEDQKTKEELIRQKNEYKRLLRDYLQYHKIKESQSKDKGEKDEKFFLRKLQQLQSKDTTFQQMVESEEKGLYMKLRDEKINYLRKIHRIIFELEKRKIIDENKQYKDNRKLRNEETRYVLESVENAYKDKINMLKEKLVAQRQEKTISEAAHKQVLSKLERELKQEKQKQLNELKDAWRCEKEKFDLMVMDDGKLEQKIMALYNKY